VTYFDKPLPRRGPAQRIGRTLALVLPVVLVLSGTLAVARVNWSGTASDSALAASSRAVARGSAARTAQDALRDQLLLEVRQQNPGAALTHLQQAVNRTPSLARHCAAIARALGRAAVQFYGQVTAQSYARPVCDTSFAAGVAAQRS
jgi:hypothetical protein